jgi:hypothetical protein
VENNVWIRYNHNYIWNRKLPDRIYTLKSELFDYEGKERLGKINYWAFYKEGIR